jgi:RHS repeat-associated protein
MINRCWFGFNGKEKVDEVYGEANAYDFGARIYDPRIGRWLAVDPEARRYTSMSPYHFSGNNPIIYVDYDGKLFGKFKAKTAEAWFKLTGKQDVIRWQSADGDWKVSYRTENSRVIGTSLKMKNYGKEGIPSFKAEAKVSFGPQFALKGEVLEHQVGADLNIGSITLAKGTHEQQGSSDEPMHWDGLLLSGKTENNKNYVEINQGVSLGVGLLSGGWSREFKGKSYGSEDLKDEFSGAIGPVAGSVAVNENNEAVEQKINIAKVRIASGLGVELKVSIGQTTEKVKEK